MPCFKLMLWKVSRVLAALVAVIIAQGCCTTTKIKPPADEGNKITMNELEEIEAAKPDRDLEEAIQKGDLRFVGIWGFTREVPGVNEHDERIHRHGVRMIEGTTDAPANDVVARFQEKARAYAEAYNRLLLGYIQNR